MTAAANAVSGDDATRRGAATCAPAVARIPMQTIPARIVTRRHVMTPKVWGGTAAVHRLQA